MKLNVTSQNRRAWTGGDTPPVGFRRRCRGYRHLVTFFFREQLQQCGGLGLWKCAGTGALERARIFWNRAKLDAWRTYTDAQPFPTQLAIAYRVNYGRNWKAGERPLMEKLGKVTFPIGAHIEDGDAAVRREFPDANYSKLYTEQGTFLCSGPV